MKETATPQEVLNTWVALGMAIAFGTAVGLIMLSA